MKNDKVKNYVFHHFLMRIDCIRLETTNLRLDLSSDNEDLKDDGYCGGYSSHE